MQSLFLVSQSCPTLLQPHELQPTRLHCPWDSSGKRILQTVSFPSTEHLPNTGIKPVSPALAGRFLTTDSPGQCDPVQILLLFSHSVVSNSLATPLMQPTSLLCRWDFPGKKYWSGVAISVSREFSLTRGLNPCLLHWQAILYHCTTKEDRVHPKHLCITKTPEVSDMNPHLKTLAQKMLDSN